MRVCLKKDTEIAGHQLLKHQEGIVVAITRNVTVDDDYIYIVDIPNIGQLDIPLSLLDVLRL